MRLDLVLKDLDYEEEHKSKEYSTQEDIEEYILRSANKINLSPIELFLKDYCDEEFFKQL